MRQSVGYSLEDTETEYRERQRKYHEKMDIRSSLYEQNNNLGFYEQCLNFYRTRLLNGIKDGEIYFKDKDNYPKSDDELIDIFMLQVYNSDDINEFQFDGYTHTYIIYYMIKHGHYTTNRKDIENIEEFMVNNFGEITKNEYKFLVQTLLRSIYYTDIKNLSGYFNLYGLDIDIIADFCSYNNFLETAESEINIPRYNFKSCKLIEILELYLQESEAGRTSDKNSFVIYHLLGLYYYNHSLSTNENESKKGYLDKSKKYFAKSSALGYGESIYQESIIFYEQGEIKEALYNLSRGSDLGIIKCSIALAEILHEIDEGDEAKNAKNERKGNQLMAWVSEKDSRKSLSGIFAIEKYKFFTAKDEEEIDFNYERAQSAYDRLIFSGEYKFNSEDMIFYKKYIQQVNKALNENNKADEIENLRVLAFNIQHPKYQILYLKKLHKNIKEGIKEGSDMLGLITVAARLLKIQLESSDTLIMYQEIEECILELYSLGRSNLNNKAKSHQILPILQSIFKYEDRLISQLYLKGSFEKEAFIFLAKIGGLIGWQEKLHQYGNMGHSCGRYTSDLSDTQEIYSQNNVEMPDFVVNSLTGVLTETENPLIGKEDEGDYFTSKYMQTKKEILNNTQGMKIDLDYKKRISELSEKPGYLNDYCRLIALYTSNIQDYIQVLNESNAVEELNITTMKFILGNAIERGNKEVALNICEMMISSMGYIDNDILFVMIEKILTHEVPMEEDTTYWQLVSYIVSNLNDFNEEISDEKLNSPEEYTVLKRLYGMLYFKIKDFDTAIKYFQEAIEMGDNISNTYLGNIYFLQGKKDLAKNTFKQGLEDSENPSYGCAAGLAFIYQQEEDYQLYEGYLKIAKTLLMPDAEKYLFDLYFYRTRIYENEIKKLKSDMSKIDIEDKEKINNLKVKIYETSGKFEKFRNLALQSLKILVSNYQYEFKPEHSVLYANEIHICNLHTRHEEFKEIFKHSYRMLFYYNNNDALKNMVRYLLQLADYYNDYIKLNTRNIEFNKHPLLSSIHEGFIHFIDEELEYEGKFENALLEFMDHLAGLIHERYAENLNMVDKNIFREIARFYGKVGDNENKEKYKMLYEFRGQSNLEDLEIRVKETRKSSKLKIIATSEGSKMQDGKYIHSSARLLQ